MFIVCNGFAIYTIPISLLDNATTAAYCDNYVCLRQLLSAARPVFNCDTTYVHIFNLPQAVNEIFLELIRQELSDEGIFNLEGLENSDEPDDSDSDEGSDGDSNSEEELDYPDGLNDYGDDQYKDIEIEYD